MKTIKLKITLTEPMLGTVPMDKEVYATYIATKKEKAGENPLTPAELVDEVASVDEIENKGWTGFHRDEKGLFIYDYMLRGFLKYAGNLMKKEVGVKQLADKISKYVFVFPRKIHLDKEKADGVLERPLRAMTMQGPRVTLARSDTVNEGTSFECELRLIEGEVTEKILLQLLDYGQLQGLGQFRSGSYGRFTYEVLE
jgi:hypothetical protein